MEEKLEQVQAEIKELQDKLNVLRKKEEQLKCEMNAPDLVGKYIFKHHSIWSYYMKVEKVVSGRGNGEFIAVGASIDIATQKIGISYKLVSNDYFNLFEKYEVTTEEEYNKALKKALTKFVE